MSKRIARFILVLSGLILLCSNIFAQSLNEPIDVRTREEKVKSFIDALKQGDPDGKAFIFMTYDLLAGISRDSKGDTRCGANRTTNVIDTIRCGAVAAGFKGKNSFMDYLTDGEFTTLGEKSEKRKNIIISTLRGLYNLDPRVRLTAIEWLRLLRPDAMMFRDVERAVEYETVCSSYEKYRPKNIDIPSIDEPGEPGINVPFNYYYSVPEDTMNVILTNVDANGNPVATKDDNTSQTDPRPSATQLDARKWGNGYPFDPDRQIFEILTYIDVMSEAGVLRRFRNVKDSYLLGYQYQLGAAYQKNYNGKDIIRTRPTTIFESGTNGILTEKQIYDKYYDKASKHYDIAKLSEPEIIELVQTMVPIGHGEKYYYRNSAGSDVIGNSWAELIKLREFIVRAIWYDKIKKGELNSLVIISKDTFKTLYLSIDGEVGYDVPFLATTDTVPGGPKLVEADVPVLAQGLLKNPVYSTKWVIARALKDIYSQKATTPEGKKKINSILRRAKYDMLAVDVINGGILHEELIKVGKIDVSQYPSPDLTLKAFDNKGVEVNVGRMSAIYAGGIYIPTKGNMKTTVTVVSKVNTFTLPNDEILSRGQADNDAVKVVVEKDYTEKMLENILKYGDGQNPETFNLIDRVIDAFTFYDYYVVDENPELPKTDNTGNKGYSERQVSAYDTEYNTGIGSIAYGYNVNTIYNNRLEYVKAKEVYYKKLSDLTAGTKYIKDINAVEHVVPHFNVEHYNRVVNFINEVLNGNTQIMADVKWEIVESAELLTMYRLYRMHEGAAVTAPANPDFNYKARLVTLNADNVSVPRVNFFDALSSASLAKVVEESTYTNNKRNIGQIKVANTVFNYYDSFGIKNYDDKNKKTVDGYALLNRIVEDVDIFRAGTTAGSIRPIQTYTAAKRANIVNASFAGIYNKDPRIRLTAIHWLRRLGPTEDMFDNVRKALGVITQQEISVKTLDDLDNKFRKDRPDTQKELAPFFDTNIYRRLDKNEFFTDLTDTDPAKDPKAAYLHNDLRTGNYASTNGYDSVLTNLTLSQIRTILYMVSQDFEILIYKQLQVDALAEEINFYDMLPGYNPNNPDVPVDLPQLQNLLAQIYSTDECPVFDTIIQVITLANPLYTEARYEYYFDSYGLYQYKSPIEELHKLYKLIRREILVNRIKEGGKDVNFENIVRFDFRVLSTKVDEEYILRIPMQSYFGLVGSGRSSDKIDASEVAGQNLVAYVPYIDPVTGDFDTRFTFRLPKGRETQFDMYPKYPIFRESEIALIARGYKNNNFIVQKGTVAFLVKFYNYYSNLDNGTKIAIRDAMYQYKLEDIAVEEVTLAFEGEDPDGRVVIKAGTKLGNELNMGGVAQYKKNIPLEMRKSLRQLINNDVQSFNNEISDIIGIVRYGRGIR